MCRGGQRPVIRCALAADRCITQRRRASWRISSKACIKQQCPCNRVNYLHAPSRGGRGVCGTRRCPQCAHLYHIHCELVELRSTQQRHTARRTSGEACSRQQRMRSGENHHATARGGPPRHASRRALCPWWTRRSTQRASAPVQQSNPPSHAARRPCYGTRCWEHRARVHRIHTADSSKHGARSSAPSVKHASSGARIAQQRLRSGANHQATPRGGRCVYGGLGEARRAKQRPRCKANHQAMPRGNPDVVCINPWPVTPCAGTYM
jgi:hypothetical protein